MVSFSCDSCSDIIKKPKLVQHTARCPSAQFTCIDCSTTFAGKSYLKHIKCISEAEKYQKSLYKGNKKGTQDELHKTKQLNSDNKSREVSDERNDNNKNDSLETKGVLIIDSDHKKVKTADTAAKQENDNKNEDGPSISPKKKKKRSSINISISDFKVKDNVTGLDEVNEAQIVQIEKEIETPKIDSNFKIENKKDGDGDATMAGISKKECNLDKTGNKKKKSRSSGNINSNDIKGEESKKDNDVDAMMKGSNDVNEVQSAQTEKVIKTPKKEINEVQSIQTEKIIETPKKESNTEKLDKSNNKKKKKGRNSLTHNNSTDNVQDGETKRVSMIQAVSSIEVLKKEISDKKDRKRKSIDPVLPEKSELETPTNKKQKTKDKKNAKFVHEKDSTHDLVSIPAAIKKIFKSDEHDELNLKRLEEMVVRELIPNSNLSENELRESFLENIVLTMKDGNIILK
ncbi:3269_t:CDS:2 [Funneliformis mosseae]|uniref:3269_t:CDS:1 n=1 Tax=Funneliformis mosseae TaxID=27381 RepID=A0A9N9FNY9_FUNMO|nr:3269_t:CDS:2 [Funneliformis mosseae]